MSTQMSAELAEQYTLAIKLLCLLQKLSPNTAYNASPAGYDYSTNIPNIKRLALDDEDEDEDEFEHDDIEPLDDDAESIDSLDVLPDNQHKEDKETQQRQCLLNALSFAASVDRNPSCVAAAMMELIRHAASGEVEGVRFLIAMSGEVPEEVLKELESLGQLLGKISSETLSQGAEHDLLDKILKMKRLCLTTQLRGTGRGPKGLMKLVEEANTSPHLSNKFPFPPYTDKLQLSKSEIERNGPYTPQTHHRHMSIALSQYQSFRQLLRKTCNAGKGAKAARNKINLAAAKDMIMLAYDLRSSRCLEYLLRQGPQGHASNKLFRSIRKISRYWQCCLDLVKCAQSPLGAKLFKNAEFVSVPKYLATQLSEITTDTLAPGNNSSMKSLLNNVLEIVGYSIEDFTSFCAQHGFRQQNVLDNFCSALGVRLHVHAEIKLVYYYSITSDFNPEPEIGCSKHACFPCSAFIQNHPYFKIPKTHNKIYIGWGLPLTAAPVVGTSPRIDEVQEILRNVALELKNLLTQVLNSPAISREKISPDSTSGVQSTIQANKNTAPDSTRSGASQELSLYEIIEQAHRNLYSAEKVEETDEHNIGSEFQVESLELGEPGETGGRVLSGPCSLCDEITTRSCSRCGSVLFCSSRCENEAEDSHVFKCSPGRPIDAGDNLVRYVRRDILPEAEDVPGFGFDRCKNSNEWTNLFGLYIGLVNYRGVGSRDLNKWQQENSLVENICRVYGHNEGRSRYYEWFRNNKHIVDRNTPKSPFRKAGYSDFTALNAWLPLEYKGKDILSQPLQPPSKQEVAIFYAMTIAGYRPNPGQIIWTTFGYCTCRLEDTWQHEEDILCSFYQDLLTKCTFDEFHKAYTENRIEALAIRKGLGDELRKLWAKNIFPRNIPHSCYALKQYLANAPSESVQEGPVLPVVVDYGWFHCMNAKEKLEWKKTYKKVFQSEKHKDSDLHTACIQGKLFAYIKKVVPETPASFERLCRNTYSGR